MTPTQLRAFTTIANTGSVKDAAATLGVTDAAVSAHVASLRRELGDELFHRTGSGLAFTPGGLRLAARGAEMLGLQDQTRREVSAAAAGRRHLRIAATSMFAEYAAPGLIELFTGRAHDLEVELVVARGDRLVDLLSSHTADVAVGPAQAAAPEGIVAETFLNYEVLVVAGPEHPLVGTRVRPADLARQDWMLGPSAAEPRGLTRRLLTALKVEERRQRIFQSHSAALEEARRGAGVAIALGFAVTKDLSAGQLARVASSTTALETSWAAMSLPNDRRSQPASEIMSFIRTPRAMQAMVTGSGTNVGHFRPSVHITLWR